MRPSRCGQWDFKAALESQMRSNSPATNGITIADAHKRA
jgi:hypothetical protein